MKKVILLALTVVALSSYGQKIRLYNNCDFWITSDGISGETKTIALKLIWDNDKDSPSNLLAVFYPHKRIILDEPPEFKGTSGGYPYYYFTATENESIHINGTIVINPNDRNFSISLLYDENQTYSAIFKKSGFKYIPMTSEFKLNY
jgi:hypothetical protein